MQIKNNVLTTVTSYAIFGGGLNYESMTGGWFGLKTELWLTKPLGVYLKGGTNYSNITAVKITNTQKNIYEYSGLGGYITTGAQWFIFDHFGVNLEYQISKLPRKYKTNATIAEFTVRL